MESYPFGLFPASGCLPNMKCFVQLLILHKLYVPCGRQALRYQSQGGSGYRRDIIIFVEVSGLRANIR